MRRAVDEAQDSTLRWRQDRLMDKFQEHKG